MIYDPNRPLTLAQVIADRNIHDSLAKLGQQRFTLSAEYVKPWHEKWVRYYKIYRSIVDAVDDPDEPNFGVSYAYGIIEDLVSTISEPILQMRPPCRVAPKKIGHEQAADNFSAICTSYFHTSRYQLEFTESIRELCIIGNSWEFDTWASDYAPGRKWSKVMQETFIDKVKGLGGKMFGLSKPESVPFEATAEVEYDVPVRVGYQTEFPSAFDVFPEPGVKNVRDMHWLLRQERSVAIADLQKRKYKDPKTGQMVPLFDFSIMLKEKGDHEPGAIQPILMEGKADYGQMAKDAMAGEATDKADTMNDMDRVSITWVWEQNRLFALANGIYVVAYRENVFQVPRIPARLKGYTPQKESLFAIGAIEPVENQLYELQDIHKLSMRNWVRIINKMVAYRENSVPFKDDFKPRAGGKVRVRTELNESIADVMMPIDMPDVTTSMLNQESNTKGLIERTIQVADYSPGTDGTKQTHKTLGGLMEISRNVAKRTTTVRRMVLAGFQDQMWFMEKLYSQFQMEKQPFTTYGPDGSTRLAQFDLWDFHTDGLGFNFIIEYDPSFGDDAIARNQNLVLLDSTIKYENARVQLGDPKMPKANMAEVMRRVYKSFGISDTSGMLKDPDGILDPMTEFNLMMEGQPVAPNPKENLIEHLIEHIIQANSPKMQSALADGTMNPKAAALLQAHIEGTMFMIGQIMRNPQAAAQAKVAEAVMTASMGQRRPMPGAPGGNPEFAQGSIVGTGAAAGIDTKQPVPVTKKNSGQPERI